MVVYQISTKKKKNYFSFFNNLSLTSKIIAVNIFAYILFLILLSLEVLDINHVAIMPYNIISGKYVWTFVTSMFMHGGFFHLFVNMMSLYFVGGLIEKILGAKRYFYFYMMAGLFAGLLFVISPLIFPGDLMTYAVGASGALFGVIGLLIILTPNLSVYMMFIPIPIKMKYAAPGMLVVLWIISVGADVPIGNIAHLGGLLFGLFYGIVLKMKFPKKVGYIQRHFR